MSLLNDRGFGDVGQDVQDASGAAERSACGLCSVHVGRDGRDFMSISEDPVVFGSVNHFD